MKNYKSLSNGWHVIVASLLTGLVLVTGCSETATDEPPTGGSETIAPLTVETLKNAAYRDIYAEEVQLADGLYEGEPFVEGGASRPTVTFTDAYAFGDLNGDGVDDAAVVLVESSGGSGTFYYLAVILDQDGKRENVATQLLGDRAQVQSITIDGAEITIQAVAHGPDDPMCCPTQKVTLVYRLDREQLVKVSEETATPEADIIDITWQWTELIETEPASQSLVPNPERYTLVFRSDGSLQIQADCNVVGGSAALEGDRLTITLGPSTMAYCGEESLDQQYLELLGKVDGHALENGRLVLHLSEDAGQMTFDVAGESDAEADEAGSDVIGLTWRWQQTTTPVDVISVDAPDRYTIQLLPDGQFHFTADCNTGRGTYTLQGGQLGFEIGPMTRAACPPDSLSDEFIEELQAAAIYFVEGGELYIDLIYDSGTMRFARGE